MYNLLYKELTTSIGEVHNNNIVSNGLLQFVILFYWERLTLLLL